MPEITSDDTCLRGSPIQQCQQLGYNARLMWLLCAAHWCQGVQLIQKYDGGLLPVRLLPGFLKCISQALF